MSTDSYALTLHIKSSSNYVPLQLASYKFDRSLVIDKLNTKRAVVIFISLRLIFNEHIHNTTLKPMMIQEHKERYERLERLG